MARFDDCWPHTLIEECPLPGDWSNPRNFSNDPNDPGGATMCGIIQSEYNLYRKQNGEPTQSVKLLTEAEGHDIYYDSYWLPHCPTLPPGLDMQFFDEAVNAGPTAAVRILQRALIITSDGVWGSLTMSAVQGLATQDMAGVNKSFTNYRLAYYQALAGFKYFGKDWTARTQRIGAAALTMVSTNGAASV
jgi:lysozyme family protein